MLKTDNRMIDDMNEALKSLLRPFVRPIKKLIGSAVLYYKILVCRWRYRKRVEECVSKFQQGKALRVVFLISEAAKWKLQSLYDLMAASSRYDPLIAISCHGAWWHHPEYKKQFDDSVAYFSSKKMRYVEVASFETKKSLSIEQFGPDIVFYDQPYSWVSEYMPYQVSRYALTCYLPYFVPTHMEHKKHYTLPLIRTVWRYFQMNKDMADRLTKLAHPCFLSGKIVAVGHTFLDYYYLNKFSQAKRQYVIYAPHWSFDHPNNVNTSNISTFLHNGREILSFAKSHPELSWVFKPHPGLEWRLVNAGVWTQKEVDDYYAEWSQIAVSCRDSDYLKLFLSSKALITDCGSFLVEYPPCGGAMIHLISSTQKNPLHPLNKELYDSFYKVHNLKEMYEIFDLVLLRGEDPKRRERLLAVDKYGAGNTYAARNILHCFEVEFSSKEEQRT